MPLVGALAALVVAAAFAPDINTAHKASQVSSLFSTSAQVIATLLVALALEARALPFRELNARRLIAGGTLTYVIVGAVAAIVALNPALSSCAYQVLFALTLAGGAGALLSVLAIAYHVIDTQAVEQRRTATETSAPTEPPRPSSEGG